MIKIEKKKWKHKADIQSLESIRKTERNEN